MQDLKILVTGLTGQVARPIALVSHFITLGNGLPRGFINRASWPSSADIAKFVASMRES